MPLNRWSTYIHVHIPIPGVLCLCFNQGVLGQLACRLMRVAERPCIHLCAGRRVIFPTECVLVNKLSFRVAASAGGIIYFLADLCCLCVCESRSPQFENLVTGASFLNSSTMTSDDGQVSRDSEN